jgi:hypothetical protein
MKKQIHEGTEAMNEKSDGKSGEKSEVLKCMNSDCGAYFTGDNCPACGWISPPRLQEAFARDNDPEHRQRLQQQDAELLGCLQRDADGNVQCPFCGTWMGGTLIAHTASGSKLYCLNDDCPSHSEAN